MRSVFYLVPVPVFYTERLPEDVGGRVPRYAPIVLVRPKYRDDAGIHEHELEHVRQWYRAAAIAFVLLAAVLSSLVSLELLELELAMNAGVVLLGLAAWSHPLLYGISRSYRGWAEAAAFRVQMRFPDRHGTPLPLDHAIGFLSMRWGDHYRLGLTEPEARELLEQ